MANGLTLPAMALGHIARALWRRKVIVLVAVLLTVGAAAWSLSSASNVYESNAKVLLLPDASNPTLVPFYGQAVENLLPTYAQVVESRSFLQDVASGLPFNVLSEMTFQFIQQACYLRVAAARTADA